MCWKLFWATLIAKGRYVVYKIYTFTQIHHIMAVHSNTPIWHCKFFPLNNLSVIPDLQSLHCLIISQSEIGFPGWRHRPTQPILLVTWRWTTVGRILWILKIHRKSRKNHTTITFSPMWSEQKGPFWRLRKNLGVRGTLTNSTYLLQQNDTFPFPGHFLSIRFLFYWRYLPTSTEPTDYNKTVERSPLCLLSPKC